MRKFRYTLSFFLIAVLSGYTLLGLILRFDHRDVLSDLPLYLIILSVLLFSGFALYRPTGVRLTIAVVLLALLMIPSIVALAYAGLWALIPIAVLMQIISSLMMKKKEIHIRQDP